jgi:hypothetical protein
MSSLLFVYNFAQQNGKVNAELEREAGKPAGCV